MGRWAFVGVVGVLVAALAAIGWAAYSARTDVSETRAALERSQSRLEKTRDALAEARDELAAGERDAQDMTKQLRDIRRELRGLQPCPDDPHVWLFPSSGPPGTRVRFVGDCFVHDYVDTARDVRASGYGIFLIRQLGDLHPSGECEQIVGTRPYDIRIRDGRAQGFFTVGTDGGCFQHHDGGYPVVAGPYEVGIGCHACSTNAVFRVTP